MSCEKIVAFPYFLSILAESNKFNIMAKSKLYTSICSTYGNWWGDSCGFTLPQTSPTGPMILPGI